MANYRSAWTQRVISVGLAVLGGVILWTVFMGDGPWIPYTGNIPDGPITIFLGGICLIFGVIGIIAPERTMPTGRGAPGE
jgi:hypothetical protein